MFKQLLNKRLLLFAEFFRAFLRYTFYVQEVIMTLLLLLLVGAILIWRYESISFGNAIYFTLITGLSVGYGDITPETTVGKLISICIGIIGVFVVGLSVAIATRALTDTVKRHAELKNERQLEQERSTPSQ